MLYGNKTVQDSIAKKLLASVSNRNDEVRELHTLVTLNELLNWVRLSNSTISLDKEFHSLTALIKNCNG